MPETSLPGITFAVPAHGQLFPAQKTLAQAITITGVGLHSGLEVRVELQPAAVDQGRQFRRIDLGDGPMIPAQIEFVRATQLSTELATEQGSVRTIEHLLAALLIAGVDNLVIALDGPEVPLLDGSAQAWLTALSSVGLIQQNGPKVQSFLAEPVYVQAGDSFALALPAPETRLTYGIDFSDYAAIGQQWFSCLVRDLASEIAPARTFGLAEQVAQLQAAGLIKGGSLENALVCSHSGWVNPPLRFINEPVRHKILDFWGDLALLGTPPVAHYVAYKASHTLHTRLAQAIAATPPSTPSP
ncbi:UDP-3-O-acyl-N-acetylglucosamine deacetylase [Synechococcus sp. PCC 6312]|uniref:UDP-3-O-acyl-N-acetylglucosamine deacetylase n=1 Tax=Synechococcus sp. (strain ATCC 27167 / PCC 6312) TaxID=195253 RepID=UPI00029EF460|nr:UDP-3-O-acyl-N-acetylglucosamine deacetylase [Synechococcus sp. PCC 6312]AFY59608.1 UDP-3-O-(3-hydroxymyristoyl) N-acetylglucosamine deacetylase [Synechococcus sp. PCC 6312]